jgi:all-trans-8'-apo-beta-carotenal 15,15'-oxygenase
MERTSITRHDAPAVGPAAAIAAAPLLASRSAERSASRPVAPDWMTLLGRSEEGERDCVPQIEGQIPAGLSGSLYRNGPGLFERGNRRKPHLFDGDGLVQRLSFAQGQVRYQNRFVETKKLKEERAAGRYRYATWSARKPGGILANVGSTSYGSQAGVTVYPFREALYAFDEVSPPYRIDPATLATLEPSYFGNPAETFDLKAHTKIDPTTGEWLLVGVTHGRRMKLHAPVYGADGALKAHHVVESPRTSIEYGPTREPWGVRRFYVRDPFGRLLNILAHES